MKGEKKFENSKIGREIECWNIYHSSILHKQYLRVCTSYSAYNYFIIVGITSVRRTIHTSFSRSAMSCGLQRRLFVWCDTSSVYDRLSPCMRPCDDDDDDDVGNFRRIRGVTPPGVSSTRSPKEIEDCIPLLLQIFRVRGYTCTAESHLDRCVPGIYEYLRETLREQTAFCCLGGRSDAAWA